MNTGNRTANRFLALLLLVFSLGLVDGFLSVTYYYLRCPFFIGFQWPLMAAYGPLAYYYIKSLTDPRKRIEVWRLLLHFLPVVIFLIYLTPFYMLNSNIKGKQWLLQSLFKNYSGVVDPIVLVFIVQIAGYIMLSLRLLARHSRTIKQNYSAVERINLNWLRNLAFLFLFLLVIFALVAVLLPVFGIFLQSAYIYNFGVVCIIYAMGYKGISQTKIFTSLGYVSSDATIQADSSGSGEVEPLTLHRNGIEQPDKYVKSSLSDQQADEILSLLTRFMRQKKPHLDMTLTLPMLSKMLDVTPNHLSQVINEKLHKNFFDFVNTYRIDEAKAALNSPKANRFSILGIAMDSGFNSKSTFYTAFKKHTGMTPSQFKENLISRDQSVQ